MLFILGIGETGSDSPALRAKVIRLGRICGEEDQASQSPAFLGCPCG